MSVHSTRLAALGWTRELQIRGTLDDGPAVAIVGARAASGDGMANAHRLGRYLATRGVRVVSGGALGVDGAAHRGALAGGGATTVVLGSGVDVAYPRRHAPLFAEVVDKGGALVSMFPLGTPPRAANFLRRNPLIAALADAEIVVEADVRSGSLSTAHGGAACLGRLARRVARQPAAATASSLSGGAAIVEDLETDVDALLCGYAAHAAGVCGAACSIRSKRGSLDALERWRALGVDGVVVGETGLSVREVVLRALPAIEGTFHGRLS